MTWKLSRETLASRPESLRTLYVARKRSDGHGYGFIYLSNAIRHMIQTDCPHPRFITSPRSRSKKCGACGFITKEY